MTESTPNRPSDTEAAHAAGAGTTDGQGRVDSNFARDIDNAERRPHTGDPSIHGRSSEPTAGAAAADRLPDGAVAESGDDLATGGSEADR
jgi:hypothetical protein